MKKLLKNNYVQICTVFIGICFFGYFIGCEPKVNSLLDPTKKVTGAELEIELKTVMAIAKMRHDDLAKQIQLRNLILNNALLIAETGTVNPIAVLTGLFAFYGIGSAANQTKNVVKKIRNGTG